MTETLRVLAGEAEISNDDLREAANAAYLKLLDRDVDVEGVAIDRDGDVATEIVVERLDGSIDRRLLRPDEGVEIREDGPVCVEIGLVETSRIK